MAGGKGARMNLDNACEKLLLEYKNKPVIMHVVDSMKDSGLFSKVLAVTSDANSPHTAKMLRKNGVDTFNTTGLGYVQDLNRALGVATVAVQDDGVASVPETTMVVSGDLALLDEDMLLRISAHEHKNSWTAILVREEFLKSVGLVNNTKKRLSDTLTMFGGDICHYTGISLVNSALVPSLDHVDEDHVIIDDVRTAFNLNTTQDYEFLLDTA